MKKILIAAALLLGAASYAQRTHPCLVVTPGEIDSMRAGIGKYPLFDRAFSEAKDVADLALERPIDVPVPRDAAGYTHERHKQNCLETQRAGLLFQLTREEKYARFVRDMLLRYADLYPTLPDHPAGTGESVGRLFWQTLNEAVWLVYAAQAYDCVYDWVPARDRDRIEHNVFRPMARWFIEDHVKEFDRIHNHGTWTATAVGMIGYVIGDTDLVSKALYGSKKDGRAGYLRQLELLYSPDGYYREGAYYARYAMMPFFLFAEAIHNNQPDLHIYEFRGRLPEKAFKSALQLTYTNGEFIPFDDAIKEKNYLSPEVVAGLDLTFSRYGHERALLGVARHQASVTLNAAGYEVAKALSADPHPPDFPYASIEFTDGPDGTQGGIGLLRSGATDDQSLLLMKYTSHGMEHGHYDRLECVFYDQGREILQDYGATRFLNVEQKFGGRYLPETKSWARQTIAHNTVVVDGKSDFNYDYKAAEKSSGERHFFSAADPNLQVMSAKERNAYSGVTMQRTMAMVRDPAFSKPVIIDVFRCASAQKHLYDLPFYYMGQFISTNLCYTPHDKNRVPLGTANGYQHLWNEAEGRANGPVQFTWMNGNRFYSIITSADSSTTVYFTGIGANDPKFNLRGEKGIMLRQSASSSVFATVLEPHGTWDGINEVSSGSVSVVDSVSVIASTDEGTVVAIRGKNDLHWVWMIANGTASDTAAHTITANGMTYSWKGNASLQKR